MLSSALACALSLSLSSPVVPVAPPTATGNMSGAQILTLERAKSNSTHLSWRLFNTTVAGHPRSVLVLGEWHLATPGDVATAQKVIDQYADIAVENAASTDGTKWSYWADPLNDVLVRPISNVLNAYLGTTSDSPMEHAREGKRLREGVLLNVEQFHQPHWIEELGLASPAIAIASPFVVFSFLFGLYFRGRVLGRPYPEKLAKITLRLMTAFMVGNTLVILATNGSQFPRRDAAMAEFIDTWTSWSETRDEPLLVIVGAGHVPGIAKLLKERYGFVEQPIRPPARENSARLP